MCLQPTASRNPFLGILFSEILNKVQESVDFGWSLLRLWRIWRPLQGWFLEARTRLKHLKHLQTWAHLRLPVLIVAVSCVWQSSRVVYRNWNRVSQDRQSSPTCWWRSPGAPHSYPRDVNFVQGCHSIVLLCGRGFSLLHSTMLSPRCKKMVPTVTAWKQLCTVQTSSAVWSWDSSETSVCNVTTYATISFN